MREAPTAASAPKHTPADDEAADDADEPQGPGLKGEVLEDTDHYYILGRRGDPVTISTFALEPVRRIATDEGDVIDADVRTTNGRTYRGVRFPRDAWHSKRHLLRVLKSADMLWTGSDDNVQGVLKLLSERQVPAMRGITNLGYVELDGDRPPTLGHTSPLASGWQRRVGNEAMDFVAMCFKEVEPVTLPGGTRRSPFPTRTRPGARLHRGRALAERGWDKRGPPTRGCLAGNSNPA